MVIVTGYRMLGVAKNPKRAAMYVSFGGICSFRVMMKRGLVNLNHTKLSDKKRAQNDVLSVKKEPKVQSALKTNTIVV